MMKSAPAAAPHCERVVPYIQLSGTCWFNAVLAALFYSQHMRNYLYHDVMPSWEKRDNDVFRAFRDILTRRYVSLSDMREYAYLYFKGLAPETLLKKLNKLDEERFPFAGVLKKKSARRTPGIDIDWGYFHFQYLPRLIEYMGVDARKIGIYDLARDSSLHVSAVTSDMKIVYDRKSKFYSFVYLRDGVGSVAKKTKADLKTPKDVVIVFADQVFTGSREINKRKKDTLLAGTFKMGEVVTIGGVKYRCDSMLMANFNADVCSKSHEIAGVTCGGRRYMYNGWVRRTVDPAKLVKHIRSGEVDIDKGAVDIARVSDIPCQIMPFDWLETKGDFCLSTTRCALRMRTSQNNLCFNIEKSPKTYVFIREDLCGRREAPLISEAFAALQSPSGESVVGDELLSLTAQMAVTPESGKRRQRKTPKPKSKECSPEKILNPKTNRCVKRTGAIGRKLLATQ